MLRDAVGQLLSTLQNGDGETVTYHRGANAISLEAVRARTDHDSYGDEGGQITARQADWFIRAADLQVGGNVFLPFRADRIVDAAGKTYTVLPADGDRCYQLSDQWGVMLRVHTVET